MSSVRMCDRCGAIFPEGVEGSSVGMGNVVRYVDGRRVVEQAPQDSCPSCSSGGVWPNIGNQVKETRTPMIGSKSAETETQQD